jgi:hypothetical protein
MYHRSTPTHPQMRLRGKAVHQSNPPPLLRTALGFFPLSSRVLAKTEESKNKEHNDHGANDIDDSIHDPSSCAHMGHSMRQKYFRSRSQKSTWSLPAARNTFMQISDLVLSA